MSLSQKPFENWVVKELNIEQFLSIAPLLETEFQQAQLKMIRASLRNADTGAPVSDEEFANIGFKMFVPLWEAVADINGMNAEKKDE